MNTDNDAAGMDPKEFWQMVRRGEWRKPTIEPCAGYMKAGLCIIPKEYAVDFLTFCYRNPRPCPIIDITDVGSPHPNISPEADLRTDLPKYNVFIDGDLIGRIKSKSDSSNVCYDPNGLIYELGKGSYKVEIKHDNGAEYMGRIYVEKDDSCLVVSLGY